MPAHETSDRQLIARTRAGDPDAFRVLFERKHRRVYLIAYQILGDPSQAEEVAQEVFLTLWEHCDRYRPRFAVDTWLVKIATNRAIDRWRSLRPERRARVYPDRASSEPGAPRPAERSSPSQAELRVGWQQLQRIWDELAALLPPQQRAAFVLREIEGLPTREVAAALDCGVSTVRSHIAEARRTLRQAVRERYPELVS